MLKNDEKPKFDKKNPKKTEISFNKLATPPTRERAKRADQHVYASARNIKKINIMTLKTQKNQILTVTRSTSYSHFVLVAFRHSNSPFGLVFVLKRRPSVRPAASLRDVKTPKKNASFPNIFNVWTSPKILPPIFEFFRTRFERLVKKYAVYSQTEFQKMGPNRAIFTLL